ncbi:hypothetical protein NDU88_003358 [Pleurodeles waltl]|uniref:Uncharacterized protein n=1 Tax=Pleurodeles waltl TaxID=8319 RepID=A0AAV7QCR3_PLEWA|nr:hypothetical protein NDU88_003358 [Pleurodeles waltl]
MGMLTDASNPDFRVFGRKERTDSQEGEEFRTTERKTNEERTPNAEKERLHLGKTPDAENERIYLEETPRPVTRISQGTQTQSTMSPATTLEGHGSARYGPF